MPKFTIFTPTYNRRHTLQRVFNSLSQQTMKDFEWLIIDDGSTDDTEALVASWRKTADFPIRYLYQSNSGKAYATNKAVWAANGEFFLFFDSDDACVAHALQRLSSIWDSIPAGEAQQFSGVAVAVVDQHGQARCSPFPAPMIDSNYREMLFRFRSTGDRWGFHRTEIMKRFPFPVDKESRFVSEGVVWLDIAKEFKCRYSYEPLYIYYLDDQPSDHLTDLSINAMRGRLPYHSKLLNDCVSYFFENPVLLIKSALAYSRYSFDLSVNPSLQVSRIKPAITKILVFIALPLGYTCSLCDKFKLNRYKLFLRS